jgi:hypothetical protein
MHAIPHLPPAHHVTSKHDSPNKTKIKEKQNETIPDSNSNLTKSMTHHNQTKELTTWFLTTASSSFAPGPEEVADQVHVSDAERSLASPATIL